MRSSGLMLDTLGMRDGGAMRRADAPDFFRMEALNPALVKILAVSSGDGWSQGGIMLTIHVYGGPPRIAW
jgi:hypothetical protein